MYRVKQEDICAEEHVANIGFTRSDVRMRVARCPANPTVYLATRRLAGVKERIIELTELEARMLAAALLAACEAPRAH